MTQKIQNVTQALERARQLGEVFLVSLSKQQLEASGFDTSTFQGNFERVDIYLQYWDNEYVLKYIFDNDLSNVYYERPRDLGGNEYVLEAVIKYLGLQEDNDPRELAMPSVAVVSIEEGYQISPDDGYIFVYKVAVHTVKGDLRMEVFYICTFKNQITERVWGFGHTPKEALENSITEYSRNGVSPEENPFQRIYDEVYAERDDQEGE